MTIYDHPESQYYVFFKMVKQQCYNGAIFPNQSTYVIFLKKKQITFLHYNGINSFLFVSATKIHQLKAKDFEIKDYAVCLGNISKDFTINNMKKQNYKEV